MLKFHIWEFGRNIDCLVHIAKGGCENQISTFQRHIGHNAFSVWTLWNTFDVHGFNFVTKSSYNRFAAFVVLICPAAITDGAYINKTDFGCFSQRASGRCHSQRSAGQNGF